MILACSCLFCTLPPTRYAVHLYTIIEVAWPLLYQSYAAANHLPLLLSPTELTNALEKYDGAWSAYRAFGLANIFSASLYHPYYLCLGDFCNASFDPPAGQTPDGIGSTVDALRPKV